MKKSLRLLLSLFLVIFILSAAGCGKVTQNPPEIQKAKVPVTLTVSAAASLTDAMNEIKKLYTDENSNVTININYGASGALQQQIEQGANVDIFFSAAVKQVDALSKKGLLLEDTKKNILENTVVLITKNDFSGISDFKDLTSSKINHVALGEPASVPAGQYAEEILKTLNILDQVKAKAVYAKDVRTVLNWVETGNAEAGIVYGTDAKASNKVKVVATASKDLYKTPVVYPAAVIKASKNPDAAKELMKFLASDKAKQVFEKYGFTYILK